jgi:type III secretory pathway component EscS
MGNAHPQHVQALTQTQKQTLAAPVRAQATGATTTRLRPWRLAS